MHQRKRDLISAEFHCSHGCPSFTAQFACGSVPSAMFHESPNCSVQQRHSQQPPQTKQKPTPTKPSSLGSTTCFIRPAKKRMVSTNWASVTVTTRCTNRWMTGNVSVPLACRQGPPAWGGGGADPGVGFFRKSVSRNSQTNGWATRGRGCQGIK